MAASISGDDIKPFGKDEHICDATGRRALEMDDNTLYQKYFCQMFPMRYIQIRQKYH
jgi:hypothetical protein